MKVVRFLQTWSVWGSLIVFGLCFQSCNSESLPNPLTPGSLHRLDNSTTDDERNAYSNNALKTFSVRDQNRQEWESENRIFLTGLMKDDFTLVNTETTLYTGNNNQNDNYGHAIGWNRDPKLIRFRCGCSRLRVKMIETAWLNIIMMLNRVTPFMQRLRELNQNSDPIQALTAQDKSRLNLFRTLYAAEPQRGQALDRVERMRSSILNAMASDWYAVNFWCGDMDWILDEEYEMIKDKPKRCATHSGVKQGRHAAYREKPDDQMMWRNKHDNWVTYTAKRSSYCKRPDRSTQGVIADPFAIAKGDHIIICKHSFTQQWSQHITSLRERTQYDIMRNSPTRVLYRVTDLIPEGEILSVLAMSESIHGERLTMDDANKFAQLLLGLYLEQCNWSSTKLTCRSFAKQGGKKSQP
ncbi:hypothetical protein BDV27DRAFT_158247 [Aspergillus caelatus]|uniref:Uncharacterized protein n=1 Tax=Aspergillus caelatus TaxID=61420 RepID=A0A5N7A2C0_9EURO|nr:uncharacterized protein BDV27DRAFT_158247 [Aspergillus caelatus]KAE8364017.1 hypothetical protein BDV27DRAFT_158247 [Aspergillus caelatus]